MTIELPLIVLAVLIPLNLCQFILAILWLPALNRDAMRYRWLREQSWYGNNFVVTKVGNVTLGGDCPSHERLDKFIDTEMKKDKVRK